MFANEFTLARDNRILSVGSQWGFNAAILGASGLTATQVIGRNILSTVDGSEVRSYLNALLYSVRRWGRSVELPVTCHHPGRLWQGAMTISPLADHALSVRHIMQSRQLYEGADDAYCWTGPVPDTVLRCGVCGSATIDGGKTGKILAYRPGKETVCTSCKKHATLVLEQITPNASAQRASPSAGAPHCWRGDPLKAAELCRHCCLLEPRNCPRYASPETSEMQDARIPVDSDT